MLEKEPKIDDITRNYYLKYNCQSFNSTGEKICVENGRLFYFNEVRILDIYYILKLFTLLLKKCISYFH